MQATVHHATAFADGPGGGNPCPVVVDAGEPRAEDMMAVAGRYGAETVLIAPAREPASAFSFRYFVPAREMEMCVHGTVAAVTVLHRLGRLPASPLGVDTALGPVAVEWDEAPGRPGGAVSVTVHQFPPVTSTRNPHAPEVAAVLGLPDASSIHPYLPLVSVSTARPKLIVPLESVERLDGLEPDFEALWALCDRYETTGLYPFAPLAGGDGAVWAARQFPRRAGYDEDPATGVAACALGAYLAEVEGRPEGWHTVEVVQGRAMGRPSRLVASALVEQGVVSRTSVTGRAELGPSEPLGP